MNGIASKNVSIFDEEKNIKVSIQASPPTAIILQPDIIADAPIQFIGSAIMDSLAAYTACNDHIFAAKTQQKVYQYEPQIFVAFKLVLQSVLEIVNTGNINFLQEYDNMVAVFEMLYFSGLIMNHYKSSIAFSGGEHSIAHTLEAKFPIIATECLHGEVISAILPFYANIQREYQGGNYINRNKVLENTSIDFVKIAQFFNLPTSPHFFQQFGVSSGEFNECVRNAKFAKDRPTVLNLLF